MMLLLGLYSLSYKTSYRLVNKGLGTRFTNDISIEFQIWPKFAVLLFRMYFIDHNGILHAPR